MKRKIQICIAVICCLQLSFSTLFAGHKKCKVKPKPQKIEAKVPRYMPSRYSKRILVTGAAGFIGFHVAQKENQSDQLVIGMDNFNDYYEVSLKKKRAEILQQKGIKLIQGDLREKGLVQKICKQYHITHIVHLAAYAGVRYAIQHPEVYLDNNINSFFQVLEAVREMPQIKLVYASSSSVYGKNDKMPFAVHDAIQKPANMYAVTKISNELMAYVYHNIHHIQATGLRFFTVYGPWGRPDMAYFSFTRAIEKGKPIKLYNYGNMVRDFTYIDDIVDGIHRSLQINDNGYHIYNLANNQRVTLKYFVQTLEKHIGKKAITEELPMPQGEIIETYADIELSQKELGYNPKVSIEEGLKNFVDWYKSYYR